MSQCLGKLAQRANGEVRIECICRNTNMQRRRIIFNPDTEEQASWEKQRFGEWKTDLISAGGGKKWAFRALLQAEQLIPAMTGKQEGDKTGHLPHSGRTYSEPRRWESAWAQTSVRSGPLSSRGRSLSCPNEGLAEVAWVSGWVSSLCGGLGGDETKKWSICVYGHRQDGNCGG